MIPLVLFVLSTGLLVWAWRAGPVWSVLLALAFVALWPIVSAGIAEGVGKALGCVVNEAGKNPCQAFGRDIGGELVTAFVSGWFMLLTIPLGGLLTVVYFLTRRK